MDALSPTPTAMFARRQWSEYHVFAESDLYMYCSFCGRRRSHPDHVSREEDKREVMRWADRVRELRGE